VYSEPGHGTTFKLYLPRVDAPAEPQAPPREAATVTGTETILLAEDDEILRPLTKGLLAKLGYTVLELRVQSRRSRWRGPVMARFTCWSRTL